MYNRLEYRTDGTLVWLDGRNKGQIAGSIDKSGVYVIQYPGIGLLQAKRIIWEIHHGPTKKHITHKDGNKLNTRIENLELSEAHRIIRKPGRPIEYKSYTSTEKSFFDEPITPKGFHSERPKYWQYLRYSRVTHSWIICLPQGKFVDCDTQPFHYARKTLRSLLLVEENRPVKWEKLD